jgi:SAM-dependent methyltransferase
MSTVTEWRGALGAKWAEHSRMLDALFQPFAAAALAGLGDVAGRRVLDLGCGAGDSCFALAEMTGPEGVVIGLDVSPDLTAMAAAERARRGASNVALLCSDAAGLRLGQPAEALHSRFGAMFFDRPRDAWARLRANMAPGAPLSVICWRGVKENGWAFLPLAAATPHLPSVAAPPSGGPGPFAWAKPEASFLPVLQGAGWRDVAYRAVDAELPVGAGLPGFETDPLEAALAFALSIGPAASRLRGAPARAAAAARAAIREALAATVRDGAARVSGACWLVTARA